jgi:glycosyltransferase involved in cell wall biosynthesis
MKSWTTTDSSPRPGRCGGPADTRMNAHTVSVIIPTFNSAALVTQAVDSALAQTAPPAEIIVIDDGSPDDTRQRLSAYGGRIIYLYQSNQGVAAARNLGLRRATGQFVAFLDADDLWHPRKLELQLAALIAQPDLALLGTARCDPVEISREVIGAGVATRIPWRDLAVKNYLVASSVIVRRSALEQVGEFDTSLQGPEDYDLWLRIAARFPIANLDLPLTGYRTVTGSLSTQATTMGAGMRRILRKLDDQDAWAGDRMLRRKAYGYCSYSCAYMNRAGGRHFRAMGELARSIVSYPFPYRRSEIRFPLARLRMWPIIVARLFHIGRG